MKLLGNIAFNPLSVLICATLVRMTTDLSVRAIVRSIMAGVEASADCLDEDPEAAWPMEPVRSCWKPPAL